MDSASMWTTLIAVLVTLLVAGGAQQPPDSLCPEVYSYEWDAEEEGWRGVVTIVPPKLFAQVEVDVTILLIFYRKNAGEGSIALDGDVNEISQWVYRMERRPIRFLITFPPYATLPILKSVKVNGREFCPGLPEPGNVVRRTSLKYNLISGVSTGVTPGENFQTLAEFTASGRPVVTTTSTVATTPRPIPRPPRPAPRPIPCGRNAAQQSPALLIVDGTDTKPLDWPWHVGMYRVGPGIEEPEYICGGSLVSLDLVVTAAHCMFEKGSRRQATPRERKVVFGRYTWDLNNHEPNTQERDIARIVVHPAFNASSNVQSDIAVMKLAAPVQYTDAVRPICLWSGPSDPRYVDHRVGTVVGWGVNEDGGRKPALLSATLPIVPRKECIDSYPEFFTRFTSSKSFCVGLGKNAKQIINVCSGDSGGGFYLSENPNSHITTWSLRGVVSLSSPGSELECNPAEYSVFTDAAQFTKFILDNSR